MKILKRPIFVSISPNAKFEDVWLAFKLLWQPWKWIYGNAPEEFSKEFAKYLSVKSVYAFDSGRTSLYAILTAIKIKDGDDVLVQAFNCTAAVNPILWVGANPIYVDIEKETYNMSPDDLEKKITKHSKAIIIQHTFGFPANLDLLLKIARKHNLKVIEDVAHSLGAEFKGRKLGTFGDAAFFSFGRFKIISAVFGGAAVTNDHDIAKGLKHFYEHSNYPSRYWIFQQLYHPVLLFKSKPFYNIFGIGKIAVVIAKKLNLISPMVYFKEKFGGRPGFGPSKMPNALALLGLKQLKKLKKYNEHRVNLAEIYKKEFSCVNGRKIDFVEPLLQAKPVYLYFPIQFKNIHLAYDLIGCARKDGIYLENWPAKKVIGPPGVDLEKLHYKIGSCPTGEDVALKTVVLPTNPNVSEKDATRVAKLICDYLNEKSFDKEVGASDMDIDIKEIINKEEWEEFLAEVRPKTFLESWNWGEFNNVMGDKVWHLGIFDDKKLVGLSLVIKIKAKRGIFLFIPHGPVLKNSDSKVINPKILIEPLISYLKKLADEEKCSFIRISPLMLKNSENESLYKNLGFRKAPMHMHAELMWMLDLIPDENKLLRDMRKTTRYLVNKTEKDGVIIEKKTDKEGIKIFSDMYKETAERQHFTAFSEEYLLKEYESLVKDNQVEIYLAKYNGEYIAGAVVVFSNESVFYHQGASNNKYPKISAPYLLQWKIIRDSKKRGLKYYNFWGISPDDKPRHPWAGLSLFKKGFGGFSEEYLPAQDLSLKKSYWVSYFIERIRKIRRGL